MKRKLLMEFDLSQAEARCVAWYCGDEGLKAGFKAGVDVHCHRAAMVLGFAYEDFLARYKAGDPEIKNYRQTFKIIVHATNYDVSARTANSTLQTHGVYMREKDVKAKIDLIHEAFPGIRKYQWGVQEALRKTRTLTTAKGMRRYFFSKLDKNTFKRAYAFLPQCTVAEITNDAIVAMEPSILNLNGFILGQVHDSILIEIPEKYAQEAYDIALKAMTQPLVIYPFYGQEDTLTIPVDCKYGWNWRDMQPWLG